MTGRGEMSVAEPACSRAVARLTFLTDGLICGMMSCRLRTRDASRRASPPRLAGDRPSLALGWTGMAGICDPESPAVGDDVTGSNKADGLGEPTPALSLPPRSTAPRRPLTTPSSLPPPPTLRPGRHHPHDGLPHFFASSSFPLVRLSHNKVTKPSRLFPSSYLATTFLPNLAPNASTTPQSWATVSPPRIATRSSARRR